MSIFRAVIFDLDGTLLDTLEDLADSMNASLAGLGYPTHSVDEYRYFVGDGVETLARRALPTGVEPQAIAAAVAGMRTQYSSRWCAKTRPYDGVPELLDGLTQRGIPFAVLSNKVHDFSLLCVQRLLGRWQFAAVQGVEEGIAKKPDPAGGLAIAKRLGVTPPQVCYVGDTNTDMATAVAAGFFPVGACWGFRTPDETLLRRRQAPHPPPPRPAADPRPVGLATCLPAGQINHCACNSCTPYGWRSATNEPVPWAASRRRATTSI